MNSKPIGFFDSGVGGISVLKTAFMLMPNENYIYYGDSENAPYGEKTEEQIKKLSLSSGEFLFNKGVKAIVVACNTATSAAVLMMRERFNIPVVSMEPAVKPALCVQGKIVVLATPATVAQTRYKRLIERLGARNKVVSIGCAGLVELIERVQVDEKSVRTCLEKCFSGIDTDVGAVVLGCTHFTLIEPIIKSYTDKAFGAGCRVFDGRFGTVRRLKDVLTQNDILNNNEEQGRVEFYSSGKDSQIYKTLFYKFEA